MQSEITIYSAETGEPIANALHEEGSVLRVELMKTDEMQLRFTLADAVAIGVGDYAVHPETRRRYVCHERYCPDRDSATGGYSYALTMQAEYREYCSAHKMMYVSTVPKFADGVGLRYVKKRTETKWQLTATLAEHAAQLIANLHVLGLLYIDPITGEKKEWEVQIHEENIGAYISDTDTPQPVHKFISYDNTSLLDALSTLCSTENFDCEWWFEGGTLHFGRLEFEGEDTLELHNGINAESISKDGSGREYCNRLFAFGSEQNISERYRKTFLPKIRTVEEWDMDEIAATGYKLTEFYNLGSASSFGRHGDGRWAERNPHKVFRVTLTMPDGITGVTEGTLVKMLPSMIKSRPKRSLYFTTDLKLNLVGETVTFVPENAAGEGLDDFLGIEGRYEIRGCIGAGNVQYCDNGGWRDVREDDGITAEIYAYATGNADELFRVKVNLANILSIRCELKEEYLYNKHNKSTDDFPSVRCKADDSNIPNLPQMFSGAKAPLNVYVKLSGDIIDFVRFSGRIFEIGQKSERVVTCRPYVPDAISGLTKLATGYSASDLPKLYKGSGHYDTDSAGNRVDCYQPHFILNYTNTAYGDGDASKTLTDEEAEERMAELLLVYPLRSYDEKDALISKQGTPPLGFRGYTDKVGIGGLMSYNETCIYTVMYSTTSESFVLIEEDAPSEDGSIGTRQRVYGLWTDLGGALAPSSDYSTRDRVFVLQESGAEDVFVYFAADGTRKEVRNGVPKVIGYDGNIKRMFSDKWFPEEGDVLRFLPERLDNDELPVQYLADLSATIRNGLAERRLQLPEETGGYVQSSPELAEEQIVEDTVVYDDIYPKQDNSVGEVRTKTKQEDITHEDGRVETKDYLVYDVRGSDEGFLFRSGFILDGSELKIRFTTGSLAGMEFGCGFNPDGLPEYALDESGNTIFNKDAQWYRIIRNEDYGIMLPNEYMHPENGDKFILLGFDIAAVTETAITAAAEERLLKRAQQELDKRQRDGATYKAVMMCDEVYTVPQILATSQGQSVTEAEGKTVVLRRTAAYTEQIPLLGRPAVIYDKAYFGGADGESYKMRIVGYEVKLDIPYDKQVIYCGESASYSRLQRIERSINK